MNLFGLFVTRVLAAAATEFAEFQAIRRGLLILGRRVIPTFAILTLKHNIIAWHNLFPISDCQFISAPPASQISNRQLAILLFHNIRNRAGSHRATTFTNSEA